jgi:hypothetical protein
MLVDLTPLLRALDATADEDGCLLLAGQIADLFEDNGASIEQVSRLRACKPEPHQPKGWELPPPVEAYATRLGIDRFDAQFAPIRKPRGKVD